MGPRSARPDAAQPDGAQLDLIAEVRHGDPHRWLGRHVEGDELVFRAFRPDTDAIAVIWDERRLPMTLAHPGGIYEARAEGRTTREVLQEMLRDMGATDSPVEPAAAIATNGAASVS